MGFFQGLAEVLLCGEDGGVGDDNDHYLVGVRAVLNEDVSREESEVLCEFSDGLDYFVSFFVFYHAGVDRDDFFAVGLVDAGEDLAGAGVFIEGGLDFVAVVVGVVHADDGGYIAEFAEKFLLEFHFVLKLGFIRHVELASAAFFVEFALFFRHNLYSLFQVSLYHTGL